MFIDRITSNNRDNDKDDTGTDYIYNNNDID